MSLPWSTVALDAAQLVSVFHLVRSKSVTTISVTGLACTLLEGSEGSMGRLCEEIGR